VWSRQLRPVSLQQANTGVERSLILLIKRIPPHGEFIGVFNFPRHCNYTLYAIFVKRYNPS